MDSYFPLLVLFGIGIALSGGFVILSAFTGKKKPTPEKMTPYECGLDPIGAPRQRFSVKFYLIAVLFILFDIETVFLYPWASLFKQFKSAGLGGFIFIEMVVFLGVLALGLVYVWRRGALEWEK
ncbi:MAG: NADH-quinone oxidoreductase subunit A [Deltaproteobacteria bacterium RIFCSPLOWO2_02_FULL_46_8]|nr:MAG: NADH-quinone oxidoreductase subunit A [Deltaproteobacteria bacterium RIFCSPLOWO2_02_FULL_46_8]